VPGEKRCQPKIERIDFIDPGDNLHGGQRPPAEVEEAVADAQILNPYRRLPYVGYLRLERIAGRQIFSALLAVCGLFPA
jgi:hypothetical protein